MVTVLYSIIFVEGNWYYYVIIITLIPVIYYSTMTVFIVMMVFCYTFYWCILCCVSLTFYLPVCVLSSIIDNDTYSVRRSIVVFNVSSFSFCSSFVHGTYTFLWHLFYVISFVWKQLYNSSFTIMSILISFLRHCIIIVVDLWGGREGYYVFVTIAVLYLQIVADPLFVPLYMVEVVMAVHRCAVIGIGVIVVDAVPCRCHCCCYYLYCLCCAVHYGSDAIVLVTVIMPPCCCWCWRYCWCVRALPLHYRYVVDVDGVLFVITYIVIFYRSFVVQGVVYAFFCHCRRPFALFVIVHSATLNIHSYFCTSFVHSFVLLNIYICTSFYISFINGVMCQWRFCTFLHLLSSQYLSFYILFVHRSFWYIFCNSNIFCKYLLYMYNIFYNLLWHLHDILSTWTMISICGWPYSILFYLFIYWYSIFIIIIFSVLFILPLLPLDIHAAFGILICCVPKNFISISFTPFCCCFTTICYIVIVILLYCCYCCDCCSVFFVYSNCSLFIVFPVITILYI